MNDYLRYGFRLLIFIITNLYAFPTYMVWMTLLTPLRLLAPKTYWWMEAHMFKMLECMVITWCDSGGYKVIECGDDIGLLHDKEAIVLSNHQSTGDTPILFLASYLKGLACGTTMWIMWILFKFTNFGLVSVHREDFFIDQGKETRQLQLENLKKHLKESYLPHDRKWIIVFPEGGFLYKRLESSQRYARANGYPVLQHVTLPRVGAVKVILDTIGEPYDPVSSSTTEEGGPVLSPEAANVTSDHQLADDQLPLKWIIDITIAYKNGKPLDFLGMCIGYNPQEDVLLHYKAYRAKDIPRDEEALTSWLYDRYCEKDALLDYYYKHGELSEEVLSSRRILPHLRTSYIRFDVLQQILIHLFFIMSCYVHYSFLLKPFLGLCSSVLSFVF
ncbi:acyl-CoA:lysophosphatidylglycerol acyltransferase 1 [Aplysia californica]|uniref:Acyl-CoA:lysophosphatidylglycerol acyltransferase 1 n=1 Tax=Aplysia californica TaxID=6500 RepID=A0ABM0ZX45_APLCA|nr:acyl-CoA:lysophosphatidylglycerol acyltransferase 1 [Aplysia californica]